MHAQHLTRLALVLVIVTFFAALATAADYTFYIGGVVPGSVKDKSGNKTSLDTSPIFGFRLFNSFIPFFGLEHTLAFSSDYLFPSNSQNTQATKGFVYHTDLFLKVPIGKKVVPFLTAGAGLIHQYGDSDLPIGNRFAFNYGGGVKIPRLVGPLGLRLDVRGYSAGVFSNRLKMLEVTGGVLLSTGK